VKDYLAELISQAASPLEARNRAREYLQARILGTLQRSGAMIPLAFHGGTALRFLYSHGRYSEDLDFALEGNPAGYDFRGYLKAVRSELSLEGYAIDVKVNDSKTVNSAFVRFPGLLYELGLSSQENEVLAVKLEVDTNPPKGAGLEVTVVRRFVVLQLQHHDRASLLAGKLHAIFQRPYAKGRDIYDLLWYLGDRDWPLPNLDLLNNALMQTGWQGGALTAVNWKDHLRNRLDALDWKNLADDVRPFVEPGFDVALLTRENVERALDRFGDRNAG
jgi:hypothetical protein